MEGYSVKVKETSRELTAIERVKMKDKNDAISLDEATQEGELLIKPVFYAILEVHNEKSDEKDYINYIIQDKDGTKYFTCSKSLWTSFIDIYAELHDEESEWLLKVYRVPSKNYKGKEFLTCTVV